MEIYTDAGTEGVIDIETAAVELKRAGGMPSESARRAYVAEITAGALLDIASSLRVLAAESAHAMVDYQQGADYNGAFADEEPDDLIVEGDLVAVEGFAEPAEVRKFRFTEGEHFADVAFADGSEGMFALSRLTRLRGDERDDDAMQDAAGAMTLDREGEILAGADDEPEGDIDVPDLADVVDDIDADFDGDEHPAAASALDTLIANEAARKAAKKNTKKGSKK